MLKLKLPKPAKALLQKLLPPASQPAKPVYVNGVDITERRRLFHRFVVSGFAISACLAVLMLLLAVVFV